MKALRILALASLALGTAGCAMVDQATRNTPFEPGVAKAQAAPVNYTVTNVLAQVPASLRVSEANGYYPITDIVWRGDPVGDRHMQLATIFEEAAARGAEQLQGDIPVVAEVTLVRFHGVTERTRYTIGGIYNIVFDLTVRDAATGLVLEGPRRVQANLPAPGGQAAVALEQSGQTERVRVTDFLTMVLQDELGPNHGSNLGPI